MDTVADNAAAGASTPLRMNVPPKGPVLTPVRMHLHPVDDPGVGVIVSNERCTDLKSASFVRHIVVDISRTRLAGEFRAGQSFGVIPPGSGPRGQPHKVRLYSIACSSLGEDGKGQHVSTTVKRTIAEHYDTHRLFLGICSNYLCDLHPGDEIQVTGPSGKRFVLPASPEEHDYLFLATGTGIAPFRGMIADIRRASPDPRIVLILGAAYRTDLPYHNDFLALVERDPRFTYSWALSRERQDDGRPPMYVDGVMASMADELIPMLRSSRTLVYVCGIAGMELGVFQRLAYLLPGDGLDRYLEVDASRRADVASWTRRMIPREIHPTRSVFVEVY